MKKTFILLAFCCLFNSAFSQIKKGAILMGADISLNGNSNTQRTTATTSETSSNNFNFSLLGGKAVKDNLLIGAAFLLTTAHTKSTYTGSNDTEQRSGSYGGSVWMRRYFPVYSVLYAFVNGSLGASANSTNETGVYHHIKGFGIALNVYPGISIQVRKSFFLDAALTNLANLYFNHSSSEQHDNNGNLYSYSNNNYGLSTSIGNSTNPLQLGLRWIIRN